MNTTVSCIRFDMKDFSHWPPDPIIADWTSHCLLVNWIYRRKWEDCHKHGHLYKGVREKTSEKYGGVYGPSLICFFDMYDEWSYSMIQSRDTTLLWYKFMSRFIFRKGKPCYSIAIVSYWIPLVSRYNISFRRIVSSKIHHRKRLMAQIEHHNKKTDAIK